jgi:hypothetical protein
MEARPIYYAGGVKPSEVSIYVMVGSYDIFLKDSLGGYEFFDHELIAGP